MSATSPGIDYPRATRSGRLGRVRSPAPSRSGRFCSRRADRDRSRRRRRARGAAARWLGGVRSASRSARGSDRRRERSGRRRRCRWDSIHYLAIAEHGYAVAGDTPFFPSTRCSSGRWVRAGGPARTPELLRPVADLRPATVLVGLGLGLEPGSTVELRPRSRRCPSCWWRSRRSRSSSPRCSTESLFLALSLAAVYRASSASAAAPLSGLAAVTTRHWEPARVLPLASCFGRRIDVPGRRLAWSLLVPAALAGFLSIWRPPVSGCWPRSPRRRAPSISGA